MKKEYMTPKAKKIDFEYDEQVVAVSMYCSGEIRIIQGDACNSYRMFTPIKAKTTDPCYYESNAQLE